MKLNGKRSAGSLRSRCHKEGRSISEETDEEKLLEDTERFLHGPHKVETSKKEDD
jgi:hypothetical protein